MSLTTRERGTFTRGGLIFGWNNALLISGAYIRGSVYTGGGLFTEFYVTANQDDEFSFFQGIHVRIGIIIDISIVIRLMTTKYGKQVHLQEFTQMRLIK